MRQPVIIVGTVLLSLLYPLRAIATSFSSIYTFGDSLTDAGKTFTDTFNPALGTGFPPLPYTQRFSNGPVWVEYLANQLNLPTINQYAVGGATTGSNNTLALTSNIVAGFPETASLNGIEAQVAEFLASLPPGGQADPDGLYVIWGGANDYLPTEGSFIPATNPTQPLANLTAAVAALAGAGAKTIMVPNLPDLGQTPLLLGIDQVAPGASLGLDTLVELHNLGLQSLRDQVGPDTNLIVVDVNSLFRQATALDNPFGFTNVTTGCLSVLSCAFDPSVQGQFIFWDQFHPTTAAHAQIGNLAFDLLQISYPISTVPEPAMGLALLAFGLVGAQTLRQRQA